MLNHSQPSVNGRLPDQTGQAGPVWIATSRARIWLAAEAFGSIQTTRCVTVLMNISLNIVLIETWLVPSARKMAANALELHK